MFTFQLLDKLWSQVSSLLPLGTYLQFLSRIKSAFPLLVDFHRVLIIHALVLSASQFVHKEDSYEFTRVRTRGDSNTTIDRSATPPYCRVTL